jgi:antitoxin HicB
MQGNVRKSGKLAPMAREHSYSVVLEPQPDGGFTVLVPALPEVVTEGETEDEALAMARDAIRLVLDYRRDQGLPIPADAAPAVRKVTVAAAE